MKLNATRINHSKKFNACGLNFVFGNFGQKLSKEFKNLCNQNKYGLNLCILSSFVFDNFGKKLRIKISS